MVNRDPVHVPNALSFALVFLAEGLVRVMDKCAYVHDSDTYMSRESKPGCLVCVRWGFVVWNAACCQKRGE